MLDPSRVGLDPKRLSHIRPVLEAHIGNDKLAGVLALVARRGHVAYLECAGLMERESQKEMRPDTIFRIYSMTKPVVCAGLMMLFEKGAFRLTDPVSRFIPAFRELKVFAETAGTEGDLVDLRREVTIRDLFTHTSGLTYSFLEYGRVEEMYREAAVLSLVPLADFIDGLLQLPLAFQPGSRWRYSYSHDVIARLIEILSGQTLDEYLRQSIFEPLGMVDTGFYVPADKHDRFAAMYGSFDIADPSTTLTKWFGGAMMGLNHLLAAPTTCLESSPHNILRGSGGLVSTAGDYLRFCQMMLNQGELDGQRLLGRKTVELMTLNHLAPELLPFELGGIVSPGQGYGLGVRVVMDVAQFQQPGSVGDFAWGGAATTSFWVDPREELIGILMAQYQPSGYHLVVPDFRAAVYQAIID